jgi:hypothetical protein
MRIGVDYYSMGLNLCGNNPYGEFEDYAVNLTPDVIGPVITIKGENPLSLEECLFCTYEDAGATAFDNVYGNLTDSIHTTIAVNLQKTGTGIVTYEVTDSVGNKSIAYRTIIITRDTTKPSLSIIGADTIYHEVNTYFDDLGVSVSDNATPRKDIKVDTVSTVDSTELGVYTITYSAEDNKRNKITKVRVVIVQDKTPPSITFTESDFLKHQIYTKFTDPGAKVKDNYWPDSSHEVTGTVDVNKRGTYLLTYTATDQSGNTANVKRKVKVDDYIPPTVIVPSYYDTVELEVFHPFVDPPNIRMKDNFFPTDELKLARTGQVMDHYTGFYQVGYFAYDPALNLSDTSWIVVHVVDLTPPQIYVLGKLVDTIKRWGKFIDSGYLAGDNYDSIIDVSVGGTFKNTQELGTFTRTYTAIDKSGNKSLPAIRWITIVQPAGIEDLPSLVSLLECYPNPATHHVVFKIELRDRMDVRIYMTNMLGDNLGEVYSGLARNVTVNRDVSTLPGGIYLVHYHVGQEHLVRRLVISR